MFEEKKPSGTHDSEKKRGFWHGASLFSLIPGLIDLIRRGFKSSEADTGAFEPSLNRYCVLLLPFVPSKGEGQEKVSFEKTLKSELLKIKRDQGLNLQVKFIQDQPHPKSDRDAGAIGRQFNADLVIWGMGSDEHSPDQRGALNFVIVDEMPLNPHGFTKAELENFNTLGIKAGKRSKDTNMMVHWILLIRGSENNVYQAALDHWETNQAKHNELFFFDLASGYADFGLYQMAIKYFDKAVKANSDSPESYFYRGVAKIKLGLWQEALEDYSQAIVLNPKEASAYFNRGSILLEQERYEEAIGDYGQAIIHYPEFTTAYLHRGIAKNELGQFEAGIKDFNQAISLQPSSEKAYFNRGFSREQMGAFEPAINDYNQAIVLHPAFADAYNRRGITKTKQEKWQEAIADFGLAISHDPQNLKFYIHRGTARIRLGQLEESISDFEKVIDLEPEDPSGYYNLACAFSLQGQLDPAFSALEQALKLDDDSHFYKLSHIDIDLKNVRNHPNFSELLRQKNRDDPE